MPPDGLPAAVLIQSLSEKIFFGLIELFISIPLSQSDCFFPSLILVILLKGEVLPPSFNNPQANSPTENYTVLWDISIYTSVSLLLSQTSLDNPGNSGLSLRCGSLLKCVFDLKPCWVITTPQTGALACGSQGSLVFLMSFSQVTPASPDLSVVSVFYMNGCLFPTWLSHFEICFS